MVRLSPVLTETVKSGTISALRLSTLVTFTCAEEDGSGGGVAETEGARARREKELAMAPVPPDGCWELGKSMGTSMVGMMMESMGLLPIHFSRFYNPPRRLTFPGVVPYPPPSLLTTTDKIEMGVVLQLMELVDNRMKNRRCRFVSFREVVRSILLLLMLMLKGVTLDIVIADDVAVRLIISSQGLALTQENWMERALNVLRMRQTLKQ